MGSRSLFERPDRRRYSAVVIASACLAATAFGFASNASVTAAAGQYNPGVTIKSANVSKDGTQVTVSGTVSCSPSRSVVLSASVVQGANSAYTGLSGALGLTCDATKTSFSLTATTANAPPGSGGPLSKGPATVGVSAGSADLSANVTLNLK